jgi:hypothetical protein
MRCAAVLAVAFAAAVSLLSACSVPLDQQSIRIHDDQFDDSATILGKEMSEIPFGGVAKLWYIRSFVDKKTGAVGHQLYIWTRYSGDWHFYQAGADDQAHKLPFVQIDRHVNDCHEYDCSFTEIFGLMLQDQTLRRQAVSGFAVKVWAKDGTTIILPVEPGQIEPQLEAVDGYRSAHGLAGAARTGGS